MKVYDQQRYFRTCKQDHYNDLAFCTIDWVGAFAAAVCVGMIVICVELAIVITAQTASLSQTEKQFYAISKTTVTSTLTSCWPATTARARWKEAAARRLRKIMAAG